MIFRKNYLPDLSVYQDTDGKWFAEEPRDWRGERYVFIFDQKDKKGHISRLYDPTKFDTLDDLVEALYWYAYNEHLKAIKEQVTYNKVKVRL